jgi:hypothetical protein
MRINSLVKRAATTDIGTSPDLPSTTSSACLAAATCEASDEQLAGAKDAPYIRRRWMCRRPEDAEDSPGQRGSRPRGVRRSRRLRQGCDGATPNAAILPGPQRCARPWCARAPAASRLFRTGALHGRVASHSDLSLHTLARGKHRTKTPLTRAPSARDSPVKEHPPPSGTKRVGLPMLRPERLRQPSWPLRSLPVRIRALETGARPMR